MHVIKLPMATFSTDAGNSDALGHMQILYINTSLHMHASAQSGALSSLKLCFQIKSTLLAYMIL